MKKFVLLVMVFALLLAGCGKNKAQETEPAMESHSTTAATEALGAAETTEETVPGVADSIFDDDGNVQQTEPSEESEESQAATKPEETEPEETKPQATIPSGSAGGNGSNGNNGNNGNHGESGGLMDPESPEEPESTTPPATQPPATEAPDPEEPTQGGGNNSGTTTMTEYEKYHAMSPSEQQAFMESFESIDAFFVWYENAKAAHDAAKPPIDVGDGSIDLDNIAGGNG